MFAGCDVPARHTKKTSKILEFELVIIFGRLLLERLLQTERLPPSGAVDGRAAARVSDRSGKI